jgi:GMP synthase-like glutamine amidotransferase
MRFHCLQHVIFETPGLLAEWIRQRGHSLQLTLVSQAGNLPAVDDFDAMIIMGGPMSVHDEAEFPWLRAEKALIAAAIGAGKNVLGICLGAQLIAEVKGGRVYPNPVKEIGFWPVTWTTEAKMMFPGLGGTEFFYGTTELFHWHGETFDLPPGAVLLASSEACVNQAFRLGPNVLGLQFHPEVTPEIVSEMIKHEGHELVQGPYVQDARAMRERAGEQGQPGWLLDSFFHH